MSTITVQRHIPADADAVFAVVADPHAVSSWNRIVQRTVEAPPALVEGSEWVVELSALGQTWRSRSTVRSIDRGVRQLRYRSVTDDGNPSHADWSWTVTPTGTGCVVAVSADLHPATFWRRLLLVKVRAHQLRSTEIPDSLDRLTAAVVDPAVP